MSVIGARSSSILRRQEQGLRETGVPFRRVVTDVEAFQQELDSAKGEDKLLLVELFSHWCGFCQALVHILTEINYNSDAETLYESGLAFAAVDLDLMLKSIKEQEKSMDWNAGADDTAPSRWTRLLVYWMGTVEPVFLFFRRGRLIAIVEGPNAPQIEFNLEWGSRKEIDVSNIRIAKTQREVNRAVFTVQSRWRRRRWMRKQGEYIDGKWVSNEELRAKEEELKKEEKAKEAIRKRERAAIMIQKHIRGYLARRWFRRNKRQLLQRYRAQRRARGDRRGSSVSERRRSSVSNVRRDSSRGQSPKGRRPSSALGRRPSQPASRRPSQARASSPSIPGSRPASAMSGRVSVPGGATPKGSQQS
eukprot:Hpha_TRINITY_DN15109_c2_g5::TRINITY_DN15109_c2_g5_i1::g.130235::m.130235